MQVPDLLAALPPGPLDGARRIATRLAREGHRVWLVGGCVRDLLLGRTPGDLDLTSSAPPELVERLFPQVVDVGREFGVVLVLVDGLPYEVATFRSDLAGGDGRRPGGVELGASLEADAARRDFTINAIYMDPVNGQVADPVGGARDLQDRVLRTVGDPTLRFEEDSLRLLRMARFEAGLALTPATGLHASARGQAGGLARVSRERVLAELDKVDGLPERSAALQVLEECALLEPIELGGEGLPRSLVLCELGQPGFLLETLFDPGPGVQGRAELARTRLRGWPLSKDRSRIASDTIRAAEGLAGLGRPGDRDFDPAPAARLLREEAGRRALTLESAWCRAHDEDASWVEALAGWSDSRELAPPRILQPTDLIALGIPAGPLLGQALRALEDEQLRGRVQDRVGAEAFMAAWFARQA